MKIQVITDDTMKQDEIRVVQPTHSEVVFDGPRLLIRTNYTVRATITNVSPAT